MNEVFPIHRHRRLSAREQAQQQSVDTSSEVNTSFWLDGQQVTATAGATVLDAARQHGVFIPALCAHPELPPACAGMDEAEGSNAWGGCGLCLVAVAGSDELQRACKLQVTAGIQASTQDSRITEARQQALARTLAHHPHVCLTCPQRDGCSRVSCSFGHAVAARCCEIFNHCELRKLADFVVIPPDTPDYRPQNYAQPLPVMKDEPFYDRDYNLCIDCRRCLVACNAVRGVGCLEIKQEPDGRRWVGAIAETLMDSGCMFCNACVDVCPTGALIDRTQRGQTKQQAAPCTKACPAGIDVPRYVQLAGLGRFSEANAVVREKLPFPGILGRACYAPCETDCRRSKLDDPLSIRSLKRIAHEHDDGRWRELQRRLPATSKQVAVIGAGPAGLTAAFYLAKQGHAVTVYEARPEAGGMARYGIPAYRLPREIMADEVAEVAAVGVRFCFNTRIDDLNASELQAADAVFIAIGAQQGKPLDAALEQVGVTDGIAGCITDGVDFLRAVASAEIEHSPETVTVIGGGDVACDAARSARRLGAKNVDMVYRGSLERLRAHPSELNDGLAEGVQLHLQTTLQQVYRENDALQLQWHGVDRVDPTDPTDALCSRPAAQSGLLISAIGQQLGLPGLVNALGKQALSAKGWLKVDDQLRLAGFHKIFAGGDAVTGPASLIDAVAQGRQAASAIDRFLGGDGEIDEVLLDAPWRDWQTPDNIAQLPSENEPAFNQRKHIAAARRPVDLRQGWQDIEQAYPAADACAEALRCLKCNLMCAMAGAELPPDHRQPLTAANLASAPTQPGVYFIFDCNQTLLAIKGVTNLQSGLQEVLTELDLQDNVAGCSYHLEIAHFYSQRENELLQAYSEQHGRLPPGIGDDELEELF
jgi:NADPH-dependent glutamate synthase beta subunit-like oxidoreductase